MIDWKKVRSRFKKLKTVENYRKQVSDKTADLWTPSHIPFEECAYYFGMSDRARGKTNQMLLFFMIAGYEYNKRIEYVRLSLDEVAPKTLRSMFDVITSFDYIEKITHGKYNGVVYNAGYWYYCKRENEQETERALSPFVHISSCARYLDFKSGYNSADSDLIIVDEFIGKKETPDDFVNYMQLQSTYFRLRKNCKAAFLANTINKDAQFFYEFTIAGAIEKMKQGDLKLIQNPLGTRFCVEILENDKSETKRNINTEYYGFENPRLASITGAETWSFKEYPHIPRGDHHIIYNNIYIYHHGKYVRCDVVNNKDLGLCIYAHPATRTYNDSIIFTLENITDNRYIYALGHTQAHLNFWRLLKRNRFYFSNNETGDFVERYFTAARKHG